MVSCANMRVNHLSPKLKSGQVTTFSGETSGTFLDGSSSMDASIAAWKALFVKAKASIDIYFAPGQEEDDACRKEFGSLTCVHSAGCPRLVRRPLLGRGRDADPHQYRNDSTT